jgi:hypothetical protein
MAKSNSPFAHTLPKPDQEESSQSEVLAAHHILRLRWRWVEGVGPAARPGMEGMVWRRCLRLGDGVAADSETRPGGPVWRGG